MATSVPVPMAIPTFACAKAGASFTPSPAMATMWPSDCSFFTASRFLLRQDVGVHFIDSEFARDGFGCRAAVSGEHHDLDSIFA